MLELVSQVTRHVRVEPVLDLPVLLRLFSDEKCVVRSARTAEGLCDLAKLPKTLPWIVLAVTGQASDLQKAEHFLHQKYGVTCHISVLGSTG